MFGADIFWPAKIWGFDPDVGQKPRPEIFLRLLGGKGGGVEGDGQVGGGVLECPFGANAHLDRGKVPAGFFQGTRGVVRC